MEVLIDEIIQGIQARVDNLTKELEDRKCLRNPEEIKEHMDRVDRIMKKLPEEDRWWLDTLLSEKLLILEEERQFFYKNGMADAFEIQHYLRN